MADINHYTRALFGMEGGYYGTSLLVAVRNRLETFISTFDSIEFQVSQATMIQNQTQKDMILRKVNTYNLQPDGSIMQKQLYINQAFYVVISLNKNSSHNSFPSTFQVQRDIRVFHFQNSIQQMETPQLKLPFIISRETVFLC